MGITIGVSLTNKTRGKVIQYDIFNNIKNENCNIMITGDQHASRFSFIEKAIQLVDNTDITSIVINGDKNSSVFNTSSNKDRHAKQKLLSANDKSRKVQMGFTDDINSYYTDIYKKSLNFLASDIMNSETLRNNILKLLSNKNGKKLVLVDDYSFCKGSNIEDSFFFRKLLRQSKENNFIVIYTVKSLGELDSAYDLISNTSTFEIAGGYTEDLFKGCDENAKQLMIDKIGIDSLDEKVKGLQFRNNIFSAFGKNILIDVPWRVNNTF